MHGVAIAVRSVRAPVAGTVDKISEGKENPIAYVPLSFLRSGSPGRVKIRFCVGSDGRAHDTVVQDSSPEGVYDEAARRALHEVKFSARKLKGKPVWTCGLVVPVSFLRAGAEDDKSGKIGSMKFRALSGHPSKPKLEEEKPVKLSLHIPSGTKLPAVAKVEVRLCIEKDGSVSRAEVVKADPPKLFDQAAIETVENWRFARSGARMCDVYEWVRFPLRRS
ncbi:MAG: TonB family protein [Gammaproteobacteria bacterium]